MLCGPGWIVAACDRSWAGGGKEEEEDVNIVNVNSSMNDFKGKVREIKHNPKRLSHVYIE